MSVLSKLADFFGSFLGATACDKQKEEHVKEAAVRSTAASDNQLQEANALIAALQDLDATIGPRRRDRQRNRDHKT